jgi:putative two-component system response regulator
MKNNGDANNRILIVDDEKSIRTLLRAGLQSRGYHCQEAVDGEDAISKVTSDPPALVILDINMPGKHGDQVLRDLKAISPDPAVIMSTAINDTQMAVDCIRDGAYDYFTKPFNMEDVILGVKRALENRRLILENREYQNNLEDKVAQQAEKIRTSFFNTITSLVYALEAKDEYTSGHTKRVTDLAVAIACELQLQQSFIDRLKLASQVHDVGKIGVSGSILRKPGKLTEEEYQEIKSHCEKGERILKPVAVDKELLEMVRHHHERYEGNGYPDSLKGEAIPLGARIIAVADTYDAMTSDRPYRVGLPPKVAYSEINKCRGSQFDPKVTDAFMRAQNGESKIVKASIDEDKNESSS